MLLAEHVSAGQRIPHIGQRAPLMEQRRRRILRQHGELRDIAEESLHQIENGLEAAPAFLGPLLGLVVLGVERSQP